MVLCELNKGLKKEQKETKYNWRNGLQKKS